MKRILLRALLFAVLCLVVLASTVVTLAASRLEVRPGSLFYWALVPQAWREAGIQAFAQVERYESVPADGPSEAVLRIEVAEPRPEAFARHMGALGYVREAQGGRASSWRSWAGPAGMVQTDIESPCAGAVPCHRTIVVMPGARP